MTYYAEPGKVPYDEWFDDKINPLDLMPMIVYMRRCIDWQ